MADLPMVCIGVIGCDENLMKTLAHHSGGMFLMANDIGYLQLFFVRQVLLIAYIMEVKEQLQNLYNRELLRDYLEKKTNQPVSDEELDGFVYFLQHVTQQRGGGGDVYTYDQKGCYCCCCLCSCKNVVTTFLLLICIAAIGWSGYSLHVAVTSGYPGAEPSNVTFAIASLIISLIYSCGCSVHLIYLRIKDDESMLWIVEVLSVMFLVVPEVLLFAAVFNSDGVFVLPSAIVLVSVMGVCCCCNCCVRWFSKWRWFG